MKHSLRTEHIELTDSDKEKLEDNLNRLEKHITMPYVTDVTISHDTHHTHGKVTRCIIIIQCGKKVYRTERSEDTVQDAIDSAASAMRSELASDHDKKKDHN
ncbi:MAG: HPF/RaiA family ribosome-associated protein [Candidatus Andersenbacteria bacterium]